MQTLLSNKVKFYCLISNLESKEGLDAVGSVETIQTVGPDGAALSAGRKAFKISFKSTCASLSSHTYTHISNVFIFDIRVLDTLGDTDYFCKLQHKFSSFPTF